MSLYLDYEVDYLEFKYEDKNYIMNTNITHTLELEENGRGSYEYHGHMEHDSQESYVSDFAKATFKNTQIFLEGEDSEIENPSEKLVNIAEQKAFEQTVEKAEEDAND